MMQHQLPPDYIIQMQDLLGERAESFFNSFPLPRASGLRLHSLKTMQEQYEGAVANAKQLFGLTPVPWCSEGYYYIEETRPGKHPYHAAGLYYIQEPSAMSAVELMAPWPGETILDLAAAPGGKTTQIAARMQGQGLLIANEIHPARAKILSENVERLGISNAVVTQAAPDELSARFSSFFDRILLDAPCSGEGMFRKDPDAIEQWSLTHTKMCAARQADILEHAAVMLKPGGTLTYSTCTFNRLENEDCMEKFLQLHPEFSLQHTERLWPQEVQGEGHFVAVLRKQDNPAKTAGDTPLAKRNGKRRKTGGRSGTGLADMELFKSFCSQALPGFELGAGEPLRFGEGLYWLPISEEDGFGAASLDGLRIMRPGLHLGQIRKGRFEPAHALALAAPAPKAAWLQSYAPDAAEIEAYLHGETLAAHDGSAGWGLIAVNGLPLGWGKASSGQVKNHLPKGLRR
ncbi:RsmB/NOP family class I SAM-dependent RNA methyltransferase [Paenibacillus sp. GCM10012307]|uniref:RsmB/NOP family class I SAM-dependent RNA methyltransferase n=1 Tax=Paenibacillus roseus TaxID=2798579 RepID=A0A934MNI2_9BACL|nr:RsmB/NOP family class I SAM-dependent RNA methyltransferase [Paenibacillus roseus]MBJ6359873.1 RsmB/NOP family class I SAM-dependent RNA methyltransferase [Paenibacillus roseus]